MSELPADPRYIERPPMRVDGVHKDTKWWVELTDPDDITRRTKFKVQEEIVALYHKDELPAVTIFEIFKDLVIAHLVQEWSFGEPPNKDPEKVRDLPDHVHERLVEETEAFRESLDFMKAGRAVMAARAEPSAEPAGTSGSADGAGGTSSPGTSQTPA